MKRASIYVLLVLLVACKKDPEPISVSQGRHLAGDPGASRTWIFVDGSYKASGPPQLFIFANCMGDNLYTFSNDTQHGYQAKEGTSKCDLSDPDNVEHGTWTFSDDGQSLTITSVSTTVNGGALFSYFGQPFTAKISVINEGVMGLKLDHMYQGSMYAFTLNFKKL